MTQPLFNTSHVLKRRAAAAAERVVESEIAARLQERLLEVKGDYTRVLQLDGRALEPGFVMGEVPPFYDAVTANLLLPVVEDVPVFIVSALRALRPDGLLLMTTLGLESFREFRAAWAALGEERGHVIPLTDVRETGALLQRLKLALPVVDRDVLTVTFRDFQALYAALRAHGAANFNTARPQGLLTPRRLRALEDVYRRLFPREDGRIPLTLEVIYLHGFKSADTQPQAAARGSGKVSLVRILGES